MREWREASAEEQKILNGMYGRGIGHITVSPAVKQIIEFLNACMVTKWIQVPWSKKQIMKAAKIAGINVKIREKNGAVYIKLPPTKERKLPGGKGR